MFKNTRRYIIIFWIISLLSFGVFLIYHSEFLSPRNLAIFIEWFWIWWLIVYALLFFFRGLLLVPSTPLILVGMILFPESAHAVFAISMTGILFSAVIIYKFSDILGLDEYFEENVKSTKIKKVIEKYGFYAVTFWSFFLVLPTDLICYIAWAVRMNIYKFITAVALGEGFIIWLFIYGGRDIISYFHGYFF